MGDKQQLTKEHTRVMEDLITLSSPAKLVSAFDVSSSNNSINSFPTYGLIKVSNSDDSSEWSISEHVGTRKRDSLKSTVSTIDHGSLPIYIDGSQLTLTLPYQEFEDVIEHPSDPFDRIHSLLSRLVLSYKSEYGALISTGVFLNRKALEGLLPNGSVKLGVMTELTSLLTKFSQGEELTVEATEPTLRYYEKLLDAFDILEETNDSHSVTHPLIPQESPLRRTYTNDSTATHHKKRDSMLNLLTGRRLRRSNAPSVAPDTIKTHSRSVSVASMTSTRSQKRDQCSVSDYFTKLEVLACAMGQAQKVYHDGFSVALTRVIHFMDEYLMGFVMKDVATLSTQHMKRQMANYY
jgi:hypothetical protein